MSKFNYHTPWPRRWLHKIPLVGWHFRTSDQKNQQLIRDEKSRALHSKIAIKNLEEISIEPFYLYLRPFSSTGKLDICISWVRATMPVTNRSFTWSDWRDLETILGEALEISGPLVGLGKPGEFIGAGRIAVTDDNWKREFLHLSRLARMLFVVPSHQKGTLWEITKIKEANNLLCKTIFIIPPKMRPYMTCSNAFYHEVWKQSKVRKQSQEERIKSFNSSKNLLKTRKYDKFDSIQDEAIKTLKGFAFHVPEGIHNDGLLLLFKPNGDIQFKQPLIIREPASFAGKLLDIYKNRKQLERRLSLPALRQALSDFEAKI